LILAAFISIRSHSLSNDKGIAASACSAAKAYTRQSSASPRTPPLRRAWRCAGTRSLTLAALLRHQRISVPREEVDQRFGKELLEVGGRPLGREVAETGRRVGNLPATVNCGLRAAHAYGVKQRAVPAAEFLRPDPQRAGLRQLADVLTGHGAMLGILRLRHQCRIGS